MNIQPISYKQDTTFKAKNDILSKDLTPAAIKTICSEIKKATGVNVNKDLLQGDCFVKPSGELRHPRLYGNMECVYRNDDGKAIRSIEVHPHPAHWNVQIVEEYLSDGERLVKYYKCSNGDISGVIFFDKKAGKNLNFDIDENGNVSRIQQFP